MKLTPASSAAWMMRIDSSWSLLPQAPNIIAPRHSLETETPVRPRMRCSIVLPPVRRGGRGVRLHRGPASEQAQGFRVAGAGLGGAGEDRQSGVGDEVEAVVGQRELTDDR